MKAAQPPAGKIPATSAILPRADSTRPEIGPPGLHGAAAPNELGFELWTAGLAPADRQYNRRDVPELRHVPKESLLHPSMYSKGLGLAHISFAHLHWRNRAFVRFLSLNIFS